MKARFLTYILVSMLLAAQCLPAAAQSKKNAKDTVITMAQDSATISGTVGKNGKKILKYPPYHMIGVQYSYDISGISFSPDITPKSTMQPINLAVLYTCYMSLWDMMPYFGIQTGVRYTSEGFTSGWNNCNGTYKVLEAPLISQFNYRIGPIRILLDGGCYWGYRLSVSRILTDDYTGETTTSTSFDSNDIREDYGFIFGGGFGVILGPVELHIEANYKRSMCSVYQTTKISDEYWLFGYGHQIRFSAGINIHIF